MCAQITKIIHQIFRGGGLLCAQITKIIHQIFRGGGDFCVHRLLKLYTKYFGGGGDFCVHRLLKLYTKYFRGGGLLCAQITKMKHEFLHYELFISFVGVLLIHTLCTLLFVVSFNLQYMKN